MNTTEMLDAFEKDLTDGGDLTLVIWNQIRSRKSLKTDWKSLEDASRVLHDMHKDGKITDSQLIVALRELLAAITGRG